MDRKGFHFLTKVFFFRESIPHLLARLYDPIISLFFSTLYWLSMLRPASSGCWCCRSSMLMAFFSWSLLFGARRPTSSLFLHYYCTSSTKYGTPRKHGSCGSYRSAFQFTLWHSSHCCWTYLDCLWPCLWFEAQVVVIVEAAAFGKKGLYFCGNCHRNHQKNARCKKATDMQIDGNALDWLFEMLLMLISDQICWKRWRSKQISNFTKRPKNTDMIENQAKSKQCEICHKTFGTFINKDYTDINNKYNLLPFGSTCSFESAPTCK